MHSPLHDIPRFFILFLEELFLIFNQMLGIQAFGRRANKRFLSHGMLPLSGHDDVALFE